MPVSHSLQDVISDVSIAITERKSWGRTELEKLRRSLNAAAREAATAERGAGTAAQALSDLITGVRAGVGDLTGLAGHAERKAFADAVR